ncbi:XrtA-associated tyrosine autokinase [Paraglaciecola sp. L1A13]|uniref:XrtA-associated tyrosine autokinase n=1 Tax=Paraglaciecola sp. L1A13 TaxID=2686359 RepID=UPI00131A8D7E|nr:XrtA-associated tyrosine autokinase [Paraglaciecola sp. L1A13]
MNTIERALSKQEKNKQSQAEQDAGAQKATNKTLDAQQKDNGVSESAGSQNSLQVPSSIEIDLARMEEKGFVSTSNKRRLINEEYRAIKRKIIDNAFGPLSKSLNNSNIIMVTSSRPGEGKTFTAVNLALSIALEQDKTVLLVDADVLRPNVMRTLELQNQQGLMEYLLGEKTDIAEVMCQTNVPNLRIIPAGKSHHLSTELLASERMYDAVQEFANRYPDRLVIVDTPPLLGINETAILANLAGQAIVVAEEAATKIADIQEAVSHLNPEMAIGFVVNKGQKVNRKGTGYGYYYAGAN